MNVVRDPVGHILNLVGGLEKFFRCAGRHVACYFLHTQLSPLKEVDAGCTVEDGEQVILLLLLVLDHTIAGCMLKVVVLRSKLSNQTCGISQSQRAAFDSLRVDVCERQQVVRQLDAGFCDFVYTEVPVSRSSFDLRDVESGCHGHPVDAMQEQINVCRGDSRALELQVQRMLSLLKCEHVSTC